MIDTQESITAKLGEPMQHGFSLSEIETMLHQHGF